MYANTRNSWTGLGLTVPLSVLLAVAAGSGVFIKGLYRDTPNLVAQAIGQDFISLAVVLPLMMIAAFIAGHGSLQARFIWLGAMAYLVYTYASFAFAIQYNPLFLVYLALLGCSLYALIFGLTSIDTSVVKRWDTEKIPTRAVSLYLAVLGIVFYFLWLSELIPELAAGVIPQSILDDKTPTNAVYVLDMAWILPSFGIAAVNLWRKHSLGYTLAGVLLPFFTLLAAAILSMAILQAREGTSDLIVIVFFGTLLASAVGMLAWYFKSLRPDVENSGKMVNRISATE
jgi:hypothetical protein